MGRTCICVESVEVLPVTGPNVYLVAISGGERLQYCAERSVALRTAYAIIAAIAAAEDAKVVQLRAREA